ncbi:MAG: hypothetical protein CVU73_11080 [Deltaproteobacteria bacterium HGW-Deltaproteobacteria-8]|jgi:hypothetical protein|nr:MAG: hypothetical protein CVU73_11080 [Deltaproteobacteria bacterium HGW-Deltaproteobacteria-8]
MADITDVFNALVSKSAQVLYPQGTGSPSSVGVPAIVYAGWPTASTLDDDLLKLSKGLAAGKVHVSVFASDIERNTTRYLRNWQTAIEAVQTLTAVILGQTITIGGTVATPQNVMAMVNRLPYVYPVQAGNTLSSIATGLAALIPGASSVGPVITVPSNAMLTAARVGAAGTSVMEIRRQERIMMLTVWADSPAHRDAVAQALDIALEDTAFLTMPDQTAARLLYRASHIIDDKQKARLYRRDLLYSVEYATTLVENDMQITQTQLGVSAAVAGVEPYTPVATIFD